MDDFILAFTVLKAIGGQYIGIETNEAGELIYRYSENLDLLEFRINNNGYLEVAEK